MEDLEIVVDRLEDFITQLVELIEEVKLMQGDDIYENEQD